MAEPIEPSLIAIVTSSAFVAAVVNVGWNAVSKWLDRRRESDKDELKVAHVYHSVVLQLESFAHKSNGQLYDISVAIDRYRGLHDTDAFQPVQVAGFRFDPEPDWSALPIAFVDKVKSFVNRAEHCDRWIRVQFDLWAALDEAFELEEQRMAWYSLQACALASEVRVQLKIGNAGMQDLIEHFHSIVDRWRTFYDKNEGSANLIPELRAHFANLP